MVLIVPESNLLHHQVRQHQLYLHGPMLEKDLCLGIETGISSTPTARIFSQTEDLMSLITIANASEQTAVLVVETPHPHPDAASGLTATAGETHANTVQQESIAKAASSEAAVSLGH
jgi:hypothetical protein